MSSSVYSHPGYLYEITSTGGNMESLIKQAMGVKEKEKTLFLYLVPPLGATSVNPFNNCRLNSVMNDVDVVVFDAPPENANTDLDYTISLLKDNYSEETLLRINASLSESLASLGIDVDQIDEKIGSDLDKSASAIVLKVLLFLRGDKDHMIESSPESSVQLDPKQRIIQRAKELEKRIEFLEERGFLEKHKELAFDQGFLELILCSVVPDQELRGALNQQILADSENWQLGVNENTEGDHWDQLVDKHPVLIDLKNQFNLGNDNLEEVFALCQRISDYISSNQKTLMVLEELPTKISEITRFLPLVHQTDPYYADISIKGPIKEPTGYCWKIKDGEETVGYLLGSIHATPNYLLDLNSRIRKFFNKSSCLAVEMDIFNVHPKRAKRRYQAWTEYYQTLSTEQVDRLLTVLKWIFPEDIENDGFQNEDNQILFLFQSISKLKARIWKELEISSGIDLHLSKQARERNMPIESLETFEQYDQQVSTQKLLTEDPERDLFVQLLTSDAVQDQNDTEALMNFIIEQMALFQAETLQPMFDALEEGDLEAVDGTDSRSVEQRMDMTQRNLNMAMKIVALVNAGKRVFSCIGAAHNVGDMNVRQFLENFGLSTERVFV